ncbi:MAG: hypothetical protein SFT91_04045 [Rickettsiaceae bacterium]|nr:hypothetical protein [Rickettsiaceae bacterium]
MGKKLNFIGFKIFKLLILTLVCISFAFIYSKFSKYNIDLTIEFGDLRIKTYVGVVLFGFILLVSLLFLIVGIISYTFSQLISIRDSFSGDRAQNALKRLIESAILMSIHDKKGAATLIKNVDVNYLSEEIAEYAELISSLTSSESVPVSFYHYSKKFPILKKQASKKLSQIEFKMGNFDKALEYAKEYYYSDPEDEQINIILAKIHAAKERWRDMDGLISSVGNYNFSDETRLVFSSLYVTAAKTILNDGNNVDAQDYCVKSLEQDPANMNAAELFAEISTLQRNYDLTKKVLISSFARRPSFELFLLVRKFTDLTNRELYDELVDSCTFDKHFAIFLAIATYLRLEDKKEDILNQIS